MLNRWVDEIGGMVPSPLEVSARLRPRWGGILGVNGKTIWVRGRRERCLCWGGSVNHDIVHRLILQAETKDGFHRHQAAEQEAASDGRVRYPRLRRAVHPPARRLLSVQTLHRLACRGHQPAPHRSSSPGSTTTGSTGSTSSSTTELHGPTGSTGRGVRERRRALGDSMPKRSRPRRRPSATRATVTARAPHEHTTPRQLI